MSRSNEAALDRVQKDVTNAMNRTLTKVKREQTKLIVQDIAIKNKTIESKFSSHYVRAKKNDMNIKILTAPRNITPTMLPRKQARHGVVVTLNSNKKTFLRAGEVKPRTRDGKMVISSKQIKNDVFGSYSGILSDTGRGYFTLKGLKNKLDDYALKHTDQILEKAEQIFIKELEK
ncbi:MAG: hypothetical protein ACFNUJ_07105 [Campylobacter curvus]